MPAPAGGRGASVIVALLALAAGAGAIAYTADPSPAVRHLNDFYHEAWPAYAALGAGHPLAFLQRAPAYVGSLVLRAPFALLPRLWGGGAQAAYIASEIPCLLAAAALCVWLAAQPRRRGGIGWASRTLPIVCLIVNPIVLVVLFEGHPEEVLGAVLCVGAVLLASSGRVGLSALLLGLAVFNKEWGLVAVPVVIVATPPRRRWLPLVAGGGAGGLLLALFALRGGSVVAGSGAMVGAIFNPPQLLWWLGPHAWLVGQAHVAIVLVSIAVCALWLLRWRGGGRRAHRLPAPDPLLLLALVVLIRCALDPWDNLSYHLVFVFALMAWETRNGRMPLLTVLYSALLLVVVPISGIPHMSPDVRAAAYAALAVPTIAWLALACWLPQRRLAGRRTLATILRSPRHATQRLAADQRGQAITEFAIVLPVLLLLVLGIIDFARAINDWNDETHVANLAARYAAVGSLPTYGQCGTDNPAVTDLQSFIDCEVGIDSPGLQNGSSGGNGPTPVSVCVSVPNDSFLAPVTVSITTSYQWLPFLNLATSSIKGAATQEIENPTSAQTSWATTTGSC